MTNISVMYFHPVSGHFPLPALTRRLFVTLLSVPDSRVCVCVYLSHSLQFQLFGLVSDLQLPHPQLQILLLCLLPQSGLPALLLGLLVRRWPAVTQPVQAGLDGWTRTQTAI